LRAAATTSRAAASKSLCPRYRASDEIFGCFMPPSRPPPSPSDRGAGRPAAGCLPTNKIRGLAIRASSSQRRPCCTLDGRHATARARIRSLLALSDGFSKRFAKCDVMEKRPVTLTKCRGRDKYWQDLHNAEMISCHAIEELTGSFVMIQSRARALDVAAAFHGCRFLSRPPRRLSAEERIDDLRPHDDPQHSSTNAPR
jgi:hypothetical protein